MKDCFTIYDSFIYHLQPFQLLFSLEIESAKIDRGG